MGTAGQSTVDLDPVRVTEAVAAREAEYLQLLEHLVGIDSGSDDHMGVRGMATALHELLDQDGLVTQRIPAGPLEVVVGRREGSGPRILLLAHMDTVFTKGTAALRPFRIEGSTAYGPGVTDDKCGIVAAIIVARVLRDLQVDANLILAFTPDEEIGSPGSRPVVTALSQECDVAFALEAARADGSLVSSRKGGADLKITITGRAAHSGVEPEKGIHAALQMAHAVIGLQALNDPETGVTCNAGVVASGTRPNVVPALATIHADVRAWTTQDFDRALTQAEAAVTTSHVEGVNVHVAREFAAPPMEATPDNVALAEWACELATDFGINVGHVATGGIGDANTISAAGTPVVDGMAPVGGDDHTPTEWLDLDSVIPRVSLLTMVCARIGDHLGRW